MRALLICVVAVSVAGCTFGVKTCSDTSECGTGATCQQGFCVAIGGETGGGNGGGTATGGGAAQGGGAATGGGDGTGGGTTEVCPTLNCTEACVEPTGCVPYFTGIEIVSPDAGARVQEGVVPFVAQMVLTAGVTVTDDKLPTVLNYADEDGGVGTWFKIANENRYRVNRTFSACGQDTVFTTMASLEDGGFPVAASVVCDGQAPTVTLPTMNDYFQRDDVKLLQLTTSEPLSTATATLGGVALELADAGCTDAGPCFVMDFSKPNFPYIDAGVQLTVTASDAVGLPAAISPITIPVTRIRWAKTIASGLSARSIAVSPSGDVLVATANTGTAGALHKMDALTGSYDGGLLLGAVQGVAISNATTPTGAQITAFVAYNADNSGNGLGAVGGVNVDTMQLSSGAAAPALNGHVTYTAPALVMSGQNNGEVMAISPGTFDTNNGTSGRLMRWGSLNGVDSLSVATLDGYARLFHDNKTPPLNAVAFQAGQSNAFVRFVGSIGAAARRIANARNTPMSLEDGANIDAGAVAQAGMSGRSYVSIAGATLRPPVVVRIDASDNQVDWSGSSNNQPIGAVSIGSSDRAFVGVGNFIMTFDPSSNGGTLVDAAILAGGQSIALAPVLLAPRSVGAPAWAYTVSDVRKLIAFDQTLVASAWEGPLRSSSSVTVTAHPGFSCNTKAGAATGTGVLFLGWSDGYVQAVIVDGPKLEGPWPKYQRTMGNAGNDDEVNFPTNWPSICP